MVPPGNKRPSVELEAGDVDAGPPSQVPRLDPQATEGQSETPDKAAEKNDDELENYVKNMSESEMKRGGGGPERFLWFNDVVKDVAEVPEEQNPEHLFGHTELGIPDSVKIVPCKGLSKLWSFFHKLEFPIRKVISTRKSIFAPEVCHCCPASYFAFAVRDCY